MSVTFGNADGYLDQPWRALGPDGEAFAVVSDVVALARHAMGGTCEVGITVFERGAYRTLTATDAVVWGVDHTQYLHRDGPCIQALATGRTMQLPDVACEHRWAPVCEQLERLGLRSALAIPLAGVPGSMNIYSSAANRYGNSEIALLEAFARQATATLHYLSLFQRERTVADQEKRIAEELQRRLLPSVPELAEWDIATRYEPAAESVDVGGDWFDVLPFPDGDLGLVVGDVAGHDISAAAGMGQIRSFLAAYAWAKEDPDEVLTLVDTLVRDRGMSTLATVCYGRIRRDHVNHLVLANAGHPPPILRHPDGEVEVIEAGRSPMIGVPAERQIGSAQIEVPMGSTLVLYTDGLVESRRQPLTEGIRLLVEALADQPQEQSAEQLCTELRQALGRSSREDDLALLVVRPVEA